MTKNKGIYYLAIILYAIFSFLLLLSYNEKVLIGNYYIYVSRNGNFYYGLISFFLGYYIFLELHYGESSYFKKSNPNSRDLFFAFFGSFLLILTVVITAKSLFVLAYFTIFGSLITLIFSWTFGLIKSR